MSIYSAMTSALSGLNASSRAADVVSANIANAMTEGYGTRRLDVSSQVLGNNGSGVKVNAIVRQTDDVLIGLRREAEAEVGAKRTQSDFLKRLEAMIGTPDTPGSLTSQFAEFEAKLVTAANAPWNLTLLSSAVEGAQVVASTLNTLSGRIQDERLRADQDIAKAVGTINTTLQELDDLNKAILATEAKGGSAASLLDNQAQLIDQLAPLIPIQTRRAENGTLNIFSNDGHILLDYRAAEIGFDPTPAIDAYLDVDDGDLSALSINGRPLRVSGAFPAFSGGELHAMFQVRDAWGPGAQAQIDAIARDLTERFDAPGFDTTLAPGAAGLFTDDQALATPTNEIGLASRLAVNSAVVPSEGGAVWRLRDGLGAATEGPSGNASFLTSMIDALATPRQTVSGGFSNAMRSMAGLVSETLSATGIDRSAAETALSQSNARFTSLRSSELEGGVDTDAELQVLLKIEQMYTANARVITVAEELLDELMRIGQ